MTVAVALKTSGRTNCGSRCSNIGTASSDDVAIAKRTQGARCSNNHDQGALYSASGGVRQQRQHQEHRCFRRLLARRRPCHLLRYEWSLFVQQRFGMGYFELRAQSSRQAPCTSVLQGRAGGSLAGSALVLLVETCFARRTDDGTTCGRR